MKWQMRHPPIERKPPSDAKCGRCSRDREDLRWSYCQVCRDYFAERERAKRARTKQSGVCRLCGQKSAKDLCRWCKQQPRRRPTGIDAQVVAIRVAADVIGVGKPVADSAVRFRARRAGVEPALVFDALAKLRTPT